jgi:hypothetical protein
MIFYKYASEVIEKNQEGIIVFTAGEKFFCDPSGNGYTGNWVIDPEMAEEVDKVIVYLRKKYEIVNRIFLGNYAGTRRSNESGRHEIRFSRLMEVGTTESNWPDFTSGGQNPVSYISK